MNSLEVRDLINSCLLPELRQDLDSIPIEREHFNDFHKHLEMHLPLLYDFFQQAPKDFLWVETRNEAINKELQVNLCVLLFEITSPSSIFKLNQISLIHNAETILQNFTNFSGELDGLIFQYYEKKLGKDNWKRQLGAIHGFVQYLKFRFSSKCNLELCMKQKCIMFCLSVALNLRSCHEAHYKILSTSIFTIIMEYGARDNIISMNIHSVIYDAVFKDIYILDSMDLIAQQWNSLLKCLGFYEHFDSFSWNYLDDMMEVLLRNISFSPDSATSICHLKLVNKLIVYFTINNMEYEEIFNGDPRVKKNLGEYRSLASTNTSYTCYRWGKNILQMFVTESYRLMQTIETAKQILQEIHKIYILAILPIRVNILESHLITFLEKYIPTLMESIKVHKYQECIIQIIVSILETFVFHLESSESSTSILKFKQNICILLKTDIFEKYAIP